eukprot:IDg22558t1
MNAPKPSEMSLCESIPVPSCPKPRETCAAIAPTVRVAQGEAVLLHAREDMKMSTILARSTTVLDEEDTLEAAAILSRHVFLPPSMPTEEASRRAPVASSAIPDSQRFERRSAVLVSASSKRCDRRPVDPPASTCSGKGKSEPSMLSLGGKLDGAIMHSKLLRVRDALTTLQQHVAPAPTKQTAAEKVERKAEPEATVVRDSRRKPNSGVPGARRASKMPSSSLTPSQLRHEAVKKRRALVDAATAAEGEARCARTVERHAAAAATRARKMVESKASREKPPLALPLNRILSSESQKRAGRAGTGLSKFGGTVHGAGTSHRVRSATNRRSTGDGELIKPWRMGANHMRTCGLDSFLSDQREASYRRSSSKKDTSGTAAPHSSMAGSTVGTSSGFEVDYCASLKKGAPTHTFAPRTKKKHYNAIESFRRVRRKEAARAARIEADRKKASHLQNGI